MLFAILCGILIFCICSCNMSENGPIIQANIIGNTAGNIHNGGYAVVKDDWLYYTNHNDNDHLYKKRIDGSQNTQLVNGHYSYQINVVGNWIYYIGGSPGYIYRMTTDGKNHEKIENQRCDNLIATDQFVFYKSADEKSSDLYYIELATMKKTKLKENIVEFAVDKENIYYTDGENECSLFKIDFQKKEELKLCDDYAFNIDIDEKYIYYANYDDGDKLYRIKKDGTEKQIICQEACWNINVCGDYIYYRNQTEQGNIYRIRKNGDENTLIAKGNCVSINIADNLLFYRSVTDRAGYYKIKLPQ